MPDFSKYSNYVNNVGVDNVVIGADAPILEVEMNELQQITTERDKKIYSMILSGEYLGVNDRNFYSYTTTSPRSITIKASTMFYYKNYVVSLSAGRSITLNYSSSADIVYLHLARKVIGSGDSMYLDGYYNPSGPSGNNVVATNYIVDQRYGTETSKRTVTFFCFATTSTSPYTTGSGYTDVTKVAVMSFNNYVPSTTLRLAKFGGGPDKLIRDKDVIINYYYGNDDIAVGTNITPINTAKMLNFLPKDLGGNKLKIVVMSYPTIMTIEGFHNGEIEIDGTALYDDLYEDYPHIYVRDCTCKVHITNIEIPPVDPDDEAQYNRDLRLQVENCKNVMFSSITINDHHFINGQLPVISCTNVTWVSVTGCTISTTGSVYNSLLNFFNSNVEITSLYGQYYNESDGSEQIVPPFFGGVLIDLGSTVKVESCNHLIRGVGTPQTPLMFYMGSVLYNTGLGTNLRRFISYSTANMSCSFGTMAGGYFIHGIKTHYLVILELVVTLNKAVNLDTTNTISGLPKYIGDFLGSIGAQSEFAPVVTNTPYLTKRCDITKNGVITFTPTANMTTGTKIIFNVVYPSDDMNKFY